MIDKGNYVILALCFLLTGAKPMKLLILKMWNFSCQILLKFYISKTKYLLEKIGRSTKEIRKENVLAKNNSHSARFEVFSAVLLSLKSSGT